MSSEIGFVGCYMGADPEFFITDKKGKVVGFEKVIKKKIDLRPNKYDNPRIVDVDGVAGEIQPSPTFCRQILASNTSRIIHSVNKLVKEKGYKITKKAYVSVTKKEFDSLDDNNKVFGCKPSYNVYTGGVSEILTDPFKDRHRGAGGHLHFRIDSFPRETSKKDYKKDIIKLMDILVGNTCVMLDQQKGIAERRKSYGRAGEYRFPSSDRLEYRVLSNFWLFDYRLLSFVFGLGRSALSIRYYKKHKELFKLVDFNDIQKAINENNPKLALENFVKIKPFLDKYMASSVTLYSKRLKGILNIAYKGIKKAGCNKQISTAWKNGYRPSNGAEVWLDEYSKTTKTFKKLVEELKKKWSDY